MSSEATYYGGSTKDPYGSVPAEQPDVFGSEPVPAAFRAGTGNPPVPQKPSYCCPTCGRTFKNAFALTGHATTHRAGKR